MRLSDLLGQRVIGGDGRPLGKVKDVRLVQDGPYVEGFGQQLRVEGILVGRGATGVRLGMARAGVRGPWPLTSLFRRLERSAHYIDWNDVASHDESAVRLQAGARLVDVAEVTER